MVSKYYSHICIYIYTIYTLYIYIYTHTYIVFLMCPTIRVIYVSTYICIYIHPQCVPIIADEVGSRGLPLQTEDPLQTTSNQLLRGILGPELAIYHGVIRHGHFNGYD